MKSEVYNGDCMQFMKDLPDKFFELAIVDPPYGIGENGGDISRHYTQAKYLIKDWDNILKNCLELQKMKLYGGGIISLINSRKIVRVGYSGIKTASEISLTASWHGHLSKQQ